MKRFLGRSKRNKENCSNCGGKEAAAASASASTAAASALAADPTGGGNQKNGGHNSTAAVAVFPWQKKEPPRPFLNCPPVADPWEAPVTSAPQISSAPPIV